MNQVKFFIAFEARAGSGLLLNILNNHPSIYVEDEWMMHHLISKPNPGRRQAGRIATFFNKYGNHDQYKAVGFISKVRDILDQELFINKLKPNCNLIINLFRKNICKQVVSNVRALASKQNTNRAHAYSKNDILRQIHISPAQFWSAVEQFEKRIKSQYEFVVNSGLPSINLAYEDFAYDQIKLFPLFQSLGIHVSPKYNFYNNIVLVKQTKDDLSVIVSNFDEIIETAPSTYYVDLLLQGVSNDNQLA